MTGQDYTGPQAHIIPVPPAEMATVDDVVVFLRQVESAISDKMNRQSPAVKEMLLQGYGDITVHLKVQRGLLQVAHVNIGTTYKVDDGRIK